MAGILKNFDALVQFLAPSHNSSRRISPSTFAGFYKVWGRDNREAPMRLITPLRKNELHSHFEIKTLDHTANTYYALAAVVACGL